MALQKMIFYRTIMGMLISLPYFLSFLNKGSAAIYFDVSLRRMKTLPGERRLQWQETETVQIPQFGASLRERYGLEIAKIRYAQIAGPPEGDYASPFENLRVVLALEIANSQALAGVNYIGEGTGITQIADGNAVTLGIRAIESLVSTYEVEMEIIGAEGRTKEKAPAMEVGRRFEEGKVAQRWRLLNDPLEISGYVGENLPGSWALVALLERGNLPSTDGYSVATTYTAERPVKNPLLRIVTKLDLFRELEKIAYAKGYNSSNLEEFYKNTLIFILDRPCHQEIMQGLEELRITKGLEWRKIAEGDAVPRIMAGYGVKIGGKEVIWLGTGGAVESYIARAAVAGSAYGYMAGHYVTTMLRGSFPHLTDLGRGLEFSPRELAEFKDLGITLPEWIVSEEDIVGIPVVVGAAITGADAYSLGEWAGEFGPVKIIESDIGGSIVIRSFVTDGTGRIFVVETVYITNDLYQTRNLLKVTNDFFDTVSLQLVADEIRESWSAPAEETLEQKTGRLAGMLRREGITDLNAFNAHPRTWASLLRDTVLKDARGEDGLLIQDLQVRFDDLLTIMYADNFASQDFPDKIISPKLRSELEYLKHDVGVSEFSQLTDAHLDSIIKILKQGLDFAGWFYLYMAIEPAIWVRFQQGCDKGMESAEELKAFYVNLLKQQGIENVEVYIERKRVPLDKVVPTHHVDIAGEGRVSIQSRIRELEHGMMIPIELTQFTPDGKYYIADGHSRAFDAAKLKLEEIDAYIISFSQPQYAWEKETQITCTLQGLEKVGDIPLKKVTIQQILNSVRSLEDLSLPQGLSLEEFDHVCAKSASGLPIIGSVEQEGRTLLVAASIIKEKLVLFYILAGGNIQDVEYATEPEDVILKGDSGYIKVSCEGKVRIIESKSQLLQIIEDDIDIRGEVIVVPYLWNDLYSILNKGIAALVSKEGTLYHHIVREAKIPVLFGVEVATELLRDGMPVRVNTSTGEISIIRYRFSNADTGIFYK